MTTSYEQGRKDAKQHYLNGIKDAMKIIREESDTLYGIHEDYSEALRSGQMAGRRITKSMARRFSSQFHERADSLNMIHDQLEKKVLELEAKDCPHGQD